MYASENVYGAVFYMRVEYNGGKVSLSFVASKARVTLLHSFSIPHLELHNRRSYK